MSWRDALRLWRGRLRGCRDARTTPWVEDVGSAVFFSPMYSGPRADQRLSFVDHRTPHPCYACRPSNAPPTSRAFLKPGVFGRTGPHVIGQCRVLSGVGFSARFVAFAVHKTASLDDQRSGGSRQISEPGRADLYVWRRGAMYCIRGAFWFDGMREREVWVFQSLPSRSRD